VCQRLQGNASRRCGIVVSSTGAGPTAMPVSQRIRCNSALPRPFAWDNLCVTSSENFVDSISAYATLD
jgi:hypothetical protein